MKIKKHLRNVLFATCIIAAIHLSLHTLGVQSQNPVIYKVLFSPSDEPQHTLLKIINETSKEISLAVYNFTSPELSQALVDAKQRGVKVKVVADRSATYTKSSKIEFLRSNGIEVLIFPVNKTRWYNPLMHNKFAVFNESSGKKLVCTGSMNWTRSGLERNQENTIIINDDCVYERYKKEFESLREKCL